MANKFHVRMRVRPGTATAERTPAGTFVLLSHRGRIAWCRETAQRHLADVSKDARFTENYDLFELVQE